MRPKLSLLVLRKNSRDSKLFDLVMLLLVVLLTLCLVLQIIISNFYVNVLINKLNKSLAGLFSVKLTLYKLIMT